MRAYDATTATTSTLRSIVRHPKLSERARRGVDVRDDAEVIARPHVVVRLRERKLASDRLAAPGASRTARVDVVDAARRLVGDRGEPVRAVERVARAGLRAAIAGGEVAIGEVHGVAAEPGEAAQEPHLVAVG